MFSPDESVRYSRHFRLKDFGEEAQQKLKNGKVLVVGAGGLGCPVLQYLSAAGVGRIGIADPDTVDLSNLQRQVLFTVKDIGENKALSAARRLRDLNPETDIATYPFQVHQENVAGLISSYDLVIDTTDNIPARYQINDACVRLGKPLVYGAIFRWEGHVSVFNYLSGPTYRCLYPEPPGDLVLSCDQEGVVGVVPGTIGMLQALEAIKMITGTGDVLSGRLLTVDLLSHTYRTIRFSRKEESIRRAMEVVEYEELAPEKFSELRENTPITLLDVRTGEEYKRENAGGLHIPLAEIEQRVNELVSAGELVVTCQTGRRSLEAISRLRKAGFKGKCYNLTGGLSSYFRYTR